MGGCNFPPVLTGIVNVDGTDDAQRIHDFLKTLTTCDTDIENMTTSNGVVHLTFPKFKKRFSFFAVDARDLNGVLDAAKVCDSLIFITSGQGFDVQVS